MAVELRPYDVAVVSLYPGLVRTEKVMEAAAWLDLANSESPDFVGRAVVALAGPKSVGVVFGFETRCDPVTKGRPHEPRADPADDEEFRRSGRHLNPVPEQNCAVEG